MKDLCSFRDFLGLVGVVVIGKNAFYTSPYASDNINQKQNTMQSSNRVSGYLNPVFGARVISLRFLPFDCVGYSFRPRSHTQSKEFIKSQLKPERKLL